MAYWAKTGATVMPASSPPSTIPAARLLPHVLDATIHARHLDAATSATLHLLNTAGEVPRGFRTVRPLGWTIWKG